MMEYHRGVLSSEHLARINLADSSSDKDADRMVGFGS